MKVCLQLRHSNEREQAGDEGGAAFRKGIYLQLGQTNGFTEEGVSKKGFSINGRVRCFKKKEFVDGFLNWVTL